MPFEHHVCGAYGLLTEQPWKVVWVPHLTMGKLRPEVTPHMAELESGLGLGAPKLMVLLMSVECLPEFGASYVAGSSWRLFAYIVFNHNSPAPWYQSHWTLKNKTV